MSQQNPHEYNATEEYNKHLRATMLPANTPARAMRKALAKLMDPHIREEMTKGMQSETVARWSVLEKMQKIELLSSIKSLDDIRELLYLDDDEDIQEALIARKRELRG